VVADRILIAECGAADVSRVTPFASAAVRSERADKAALGLRHNGALLPSESPWSLFCSA
jgi:hypothetical protein